MNGEALVGTKDELLNANLFSIQLGLVQYWYDKILFFLMEGTMPQNLSFDQQKKFLLQTKPLLVIARVLNRSGIDHVIFRCVPNYEKRVILRDAHAWNFEGYFWRDSQ